MSGGGNKKKPTRTQGWEEAGSEFYQESYLTDAELDALQKDPKHLATLLPSKQTRAVATIRIRTNDNRTIRRQTSSRSRRESTVHRRASTAADVQFSMLPDLSENLSDEQTTWEEIMQIKAMPVPMSQKKDMKAKILNKPNLLLQGYEQFKWKRRKIWRQFESRAKEFNAKMELWKDSLKRIEGHFGTGVVAYFLFLKYLFFLNLATFLLIFLFVVLPTTVPSSRSDCVNNSTTDNDVLDLIQGKGFMECTALFYGYYPNETFVYDVNDYVMFYNLPLAYVFVTIAYLGVSLVTIVKSAANEFKERLMEGEGQFYQYCNLVFGSWDFCIHNDKSAAIKHKAIFNEIKGCLEIERLREMKMNRTRNEKTKLIINRIVVNIVVLGVLAACGCAIYYVFQFCSDQRRTVQNEAESFFYEFLPSISIVCLNVLIPFLFAYLIKFENYTPTFVIRITLSRTVLLRLASIFVLYASLYNKMDSEGCWETYVGQQIYKLLLTDFVTHILLTFFVNFPRAFVARHVQNSCVRFVGEQSFDLPKHVLDAVYSQTLCWFGCFYAPLLSLICTITFFLMFHVKKFACLINSSPSSTIYRASRSNSMFMIVLLISFASAAFPLAYTFSESAPSHSCGPFRNLTSVWFRVEDTFYATPIWFQSVLSLLTTAGFAIPAFLLLFLLLYYYRAVNSANRHMVNVLKNQLVLEGHDKQFLLERLSKIIKQQQEHQKRMRQVDVLQDGDTNISSN